MVDLFGPYVGNNGAVRFFRTSLRNGWIAHAYLITGPAHVGKRTLARALAAALVCQAGNAGGAVSSPGLPGLAGLPGVAAVTEPAERPCGTCRACLLAARDAHPDVRLVEADAGKRGITIEQVRQVEHAAGLRPYEGERKVFILCNVETMAEAAANALLKTLEEPPEDTILILTASDVSQVLPTIVSRCREVALRPVPAAAIARALVERGAAPPDADLLARLAGGRPGWAIAAAADAQRLAARTHHLQLLEGLLAQPRVSRLSAAGSVGDTAAARDLLESWLGWWRDALLVQQDCLDLVANVDHVDALRRLGAPHSTPVIWGAVARVQETRQQIDANVNARLALEALLLDLPEAGP